MKIIFVTGNKIKYSIAKNILNSYGIDIVQENMKTPEIQAEDGKEICEYSAKYAFDKLKKPLVKTDVSYHIHSLNGFPGPFIKYINNWLTPEDLLNLMRDREDRTIEIREYLTYISSDGKIKTFQTSSLCKLSDKIYSEKGYMIDKLLIRPGLEIPQNILSEKELEELFSKDVKIWHELGKYLNKI